jgi:soluble lytic murein transglycosylase-like protein
MDIKSKISPEDAILQQKVSQLKRSANNSKELQKTANEFESLFVYYMLKNMRKTIMKSGFLDDGMGGGMMMGLFDQEISQKIAGHSSLGIAELLLNQLAPEDADHILNSPFREFNLKNQINSGKVLESYRDSNIPLQQNRFKKEVEKAANKTGVAGELIHAVIAAESGGNPAAVSAKNARGLMQLIDSTAAEVGVKNPYDPEENILGGASYLAKMMKKFNGDTRLALAAYNAGPNTVKKYNGIPPYRETQQYVEKVMSLYRKFKAQNQAAASGNQAL